MVKELLEKESASLPANYAGPWGAKSYDEMHRETLRFGKFEALAAAAGEGKNAAALPALRKIRKNGGVAGKAAESAIGQIGSDEDFEDFVREIKQDPKSRVNLKVFGAKAFERILKEVSDPGTSDQEKNRLIGALPRYVQPQDLSKLLPLLKYENSRIVAVAAGTIGASVRPEDEQVIREMLKSQNRDVKGEAILAIKRVWDERYLTDILEILKSDRDEWQRSLAARILAEHKVGDAESALREAAEKDTSPNVRESAQEALKTLKK